MLGPFTGPPFNPQKSRPRSLLWRTRTARWRQNASASCHGIPDHGIRQAAGCIHYTLRDMLLVLFQKGNLGSMLLGCGGGEGALGVWWHKTTAIGAGSEIPGQRNRNEYGDDTQSGKSRVAIRARSELDPLLWSPADDSIAFRATSKIPQESASSSLFSVLSTRRLDTCTSSACFRKRSVPRSLYLSCG